MNRRGETSENFEDNVLLQTIVYLIPLVIVTAALIYFVHAQQDNASRWESVYATELAILLDTLPPGTEAAIDVHRATEVAMKQGKENSDIFSFDNDKHEVIVSLSPSTSTRFSYFSNVTVIESKIELLSGGASPPINRLHFRVQ